MPRKQPMKAIQVLEFFRTGSLETAQVIHQLAAEEIAARTKERKEANQLIERDWQRAAEQAKVQTAQTGTVARRRRTRKPKDQPLPDPGAGAVSQPVGPGPQETVG